MKIDTLTQEDIDSFKKLNINQCLINEFKENEVKLEKLEKIKTFEQRFSGNRIVNNVEIGNWCIDKRLVLTQIDQCEFIIPTEIVNKIIEFMNQIQDLFYNDSDNFLILYPSKYYNLKDKEIPLEEIGVYYNPFFTFTLDDFSIELSEMKKKPKKSSIFQQADVLLNINGKSHNSFKYHIVPMLILLILFIITSSLLFFMTKDLFWSLTPILFLYISMLTYSIYTSLIQPLENRDKIIERNGYIDFTSRLNKTYSN